MSCISKDSRVLSICLKRDGIEVKEIIVFIGKEFYDS